MNLPYLFHLEGMYTFKWSVTSGFCKDLVTITVNTPTVADTLSSDGIFCATGNSCILTLARLTGNEINFELFIHIDKYTVKL